MAEKVNAGTLSRHFLPSVCDTKNDADIFRGIAMREILGSALIFL